MPPIANAKRMASVVSKYVNLSFGVIREAMVVGSGAGKD
jgi:hypothetical protein